MPNFQTLNTAIPGLILEPLSQKHVPFLVKLLSTPEIQATLFRTPTKITAEKEQKAIEKMYEDQEKPKEITYILTLKKLLTKTPIGYVKIKLIDWAVKSCYLSVALLPDPKYRGKGYAKACYDSFFEYLFSLGFMKIYGRTYENNIDTVKLNNRTGFNFIGRQTQFMIYPDKTSHDALFFERLNPELRQKFPMKYAKELEIITQIVNKLALSPNNNQYQEELRISGKSALLAPIKEYIDELLDALKNTEVATKINLQSPFHQFRANEARSVGWEFLSYPITEIQRRAALQAEQEFSDLLNTGNEGQYTTSEALKYGSYTQENWKYLSPLFLGKTSDNSIIELIAKLRKA